MNIFQTTVRAKAVHNILRMATAKGKAITSDERGVAAAEFALFAGMLSLALINAVDLSIYAYKRIHPA